MEQFIRFIDNQLPDQYGNEILFKFKRKLLEEMNQRYLEVSKGEFQIKELSVI